MIGRKVSQLFTKAVSFIRVQAGWQSYGQQGERTYDGSKRSFVTPTRWTATPKLLARAQERCSITMEIDNKALASTTEHYSTLRTLEETKDQLFSRFISKQRPG